MSNIQFPALFKRIQKAYIKDRFRLKKSLQALQHKAKKKQDISQAFKKFEQSLNESCARVIERKKRLPKVEFPENLPVSQKIEEIKALYLKHQVIIVAGETGSGKTTQLPKMCLAAGHGIFGKIAHTQPRRIAARSVSQRIAEELNSKLGDVVGYKVRFKDHTSANSYIKLMTDGILLAETQGDRFLNEYDTIIIDEAHERSLNIDFLLGYLKQILPKRPDLKVIITSATINTEGFSQFFNNAPIIEVSGRTFPVEVRYRPLSLYAQAEDDKDIEPNMNEAIALAVDELAEEGDGDILVFLSGEKEIREAHKELRRHHPPQTEIIPLYARLSANEQSRVFKPHKGRRIILATNIAETSLTVPGVNYVIDTGLAKISRYSIRSKIQRLPVEKIAQASARQRSGRCGRVRAGIAIRLYDEKDYLLRPEFTESEILRTNLAQVILQMLLLNLGKIEDFPFLQSPGQKQINDGLLLLEQLGAIKSNAKGDRILTPIGRQLARLSIDPKLARVVIAAQQKGVLAEILIIVSALSCQDPRERPRELQQKADEKHNQYRHPRSDFIAFINLWHSFLEQQKHLSQNKLRKYCLENFLSYMRMREWAEIYSQLRTQLHELEIKVPNFNYQGDPKELDYTGIHQALLTGLMSFVASRDEDKQYLGCRNLKMHIHPSSFLHKKGAKWIMAAEIVETQKIFARTVAAIEPSWIEHSAQHLLKHHYYEPHWEGKRGQVSAKDKLSLYGLVINPGKKVNFGPIDPELASEIFIKEALVTGTYTNQQGKTPEFIKANLALIETIQKLEHKSRRLDILVDELVIYEFYRRKITKLIYSRPGFEQWCKQHLAKKPKLLELSKAELMRHDAEHITDELYPPTFSVNGLQLPLEYHFFPGHPLDGVTLIFPLSVLNQLSDASFEWLVPGLLREKITHLFRALPKPIRKRLVPIPERVSAFLEYSDKQQDNNSLDEQLRAFITRQIGEPVSNTIFSDTEIPAHLQMNFRLVDHKNNELDSSRNLDKLQAQWAELAEEQIQTTQEHEIERQGLTKWNFGELPTELETEQVGIKMTLYPALVDEGASVSIRLFDTIEKAKLQLQQGILRLFAIAYGERLNGLMKQRQELNQLGLLFMPIGQANLLKQELLIRSISESFSPEKLIYRQADFEQRCQQGETELNEHLVETLKVAKNCLSAYQGMKKQLKANVPLALIHSHSDVGQQLQLMFHPHFISSTPLHWLRRIPKYIKAMEYRLEKAGRDPRRDDILQKQYNHLWEAFIEHLGEAKMQSEKLKDSQWLEYRWLLEELKLSLFAQELKTIQVVSVKRLEKMWNELKEKK